MDEAEKLSPEAILANEDDLLRGLLDAAEVPEPTTIEITRQKKVLFRFRILPLSEKEYLKCREQATQYERPKQLGGIKVPENTDASKYRALLIYRATVAEDRAKVWDNKKAWDRLNVLTGIDMVDVVLRAGEKAAVVDKLDEISGYGADLEEQAKN